MSKIVQAINVMISNADKIHEVYKGTGSFPHELLYFMYGKYQWSIMHDAEEEAYYLNYFKSPLDPDRIREGLRWGEMDAITYKSTDFKAREATESFRDLYTLVSEKLLGIDRVLEDILSDEDNVPL